MKKVLLGIFLSVSAFGQTYQQTAKSIIEAPRKATLSETMLDIAKSFLGKPYVAHTLEKKPETLVFNLNEFDCYTLVENALALALTKHNPEPGLDTYREYMQMLRYRDGVIDGYASRMHYFTDWAHQAVDNDLILNLTCELGEPQEKPLSFMTKNRKLYPALATDDKQWKSILETEAEINEREFFYIPKEKFKEIESDIHDGDIVAFTSSVNGLDVNHEGFAIRKNGVLHLLHASLEEKKVIISKETLEEYLNRIKKHTGILVFRVN